jgi:hypothetical protein
MAPAASPYCKAPPAILAFYGDSDTDGVESGSHIQRVIRVRVDICRNFGSNLVQVRGTKDIRKPLSDPWTSAVVARTVQKVLPVGRVWLTE